MEAAIIGGTGVYDPGILTDLQTKTVETEYGTVTVTAGKFEQLSVVFLPRHGEGHAVPPHKINYRANIWALRKLGVSWVLATTAVGSFNPELAPGALVLIDQFIDFTRTRPYTFYDGGRRGVVHTDFSQPYCPELRELLKRSASEEGIAVHEAGTYICTEGPRFETPAEIRMFRQWGADVVGMTNVPEAVLAREAGLCYAVVSLVSNWAAGIQKTPLTHEEHLEVMAEHGHKLRALFTRALGGLPLPRNCPCSSVPGSM
jgi:5'-methylthioadenosine phosphorylase